MNQTIARTRTAEVEEELDAEEEVEREPLKPGESRLLISLDKGFVMRIEAERDGFAMSTGHRLARTVMIRILLKEALDARARSRNEKVPTAVNVGLSL